MGEKITQNTKNAQRGTVSARMFWSVEKICLRKLFTKQVYFCFRNCNWGSTFDLISGKLSWISAVYFSSRTNRLWFVRCIHACTLHLHRIDFKSLQNDFWYNFGVSALYVCLAVPIRESVVIMVHILMIYQSLTTDINF